MTATPTPPPYDGGGVGGGVPMYRIASVRSVTRPQRMPTRTRRAAPSGSGRTIKWTEGLRPFGKL